MISIARPRRERQSAGQWVLLERSDQDDLPSSNLCSGRLRRPDLATCIELGLQSWVRALLAPAMASLLEQGHRPEPTCRRTSHGTSSRNAIASASSTGSLGWTPSSAALGPMSQSLRRLGRPPLPICELDRRAADRRKRRSERRGAPRRCRRSLTVGSLSVENSTCPSSGDGATATRPYGTCPGGDSVKRDDVPGIAPPSPGSAGGLPLAQGDARPACTPRPPSTRVLSDN